MATSALRPLPDFLIIGAHRAGTSSLHWYLEQHPGVARKFPRLQQIKGVRYFGCNFFRGPRWYRSHFPTAAYRDYLEHQYGGPILSGDASPYYLFHPVAASHASKVVPRTKLIVLLRNPIDRGYSHWRRLRRAGMEPLATFEEALAAEQTRLDGEVERIVSDNRYYSYAHENFSYLTQGLYLESLRTWLDYYPREQICIESTEAFLENPQRVYDRVLRFLGLRPFQLRDTTLRAANPAANPLNAGTRAELAARFAPHNHRLHEYLGVDFGWNRQATS
jgi:hypothetical protein